VPVYGYKCTKCDARSEAVLLPGSDEAAPTTCADCGGALKRDWTARLHINLEGWGFSKTDSLIADTRGKDFKALKERAQRIAEE
jgi:putative FmdB family regulatory protein